MQFNHYRVDMKKILFSVAILIVISLGAWSGAGIYAGVQIEKELITFIDQLPSRSAMRVVDLKHNRGLMNSSGQFMVRYLDPQAQGANRPDLVTAVMNYEIDHHASWEHLAKFTWRLTPTDAFGEKIKALFATDFNVSGQGNINWQGVAQTDFSAPALRYEQGTDILALGPWQGEMLMSGPIFNFLIQSPVVDIESQDTFLKVKNMSLKVDLVDRLNGVGASTLNIEDVSFPTTKVQGLTFKASNTLNQGYLNFEIEKKINKVKFVGQTVTNVDLLLMFKHLNQQSMIELSNVMNETGNFDNLTTIQQEIVQAATIRLIQDGFELALPKIQAQTDRGMIEGNAVFNLAANLSNPNAFDAAKQVSAEGKLTVARMIMPPEYEGLVQLLGLATRSEKGLESQFLFGEGKLLVNGRNIEVNLQLQRINQAMTAFLAKGP
jgi:uncharacterized protein YdgA (DUF945 family)